MIDKGKEPVFISWKIQSQTFQTDYFNLTKYCYSLHLNSSEPSAQSNFPSHTACLLMHSPLEHVASCSLQAVGGRVGCGLAARMKLS